MKKIQEIAIIGGGASGIFCSLILKEKLPNANVTIYEAQNKIGKKILQTGNGKCNLSNTNLSIDNYNTTKIKNILENFDYKKLISILNKFGLMTRIDSEGRIYPYSEKATTVLDVFLEKLKEYNVNIKCDSYIKKISYNNKFIIETSNESFNSDYVIICTGGQSSINYNYNTDNLLKQFNHSLTTFSPSLCALKTKENTKHLSGLRVKCKASIIVDGKILKQTKGEVLFKDDGLSGIAIFILSQYYNKDKKCYISLDLYEDETVEELNNKLINNKNLEKNLLGYFPKMVNLDLIKRINNNLSIGEIIKNYAFEIKGTYGFNNSQVTKGGVSLSEINLENLESKKQEKLYIAGEALDVDGSCGGFNLHFAFASGYTIANNLIELLGDKNE